MPSTESRRIGKQVRRALRFRKWPLRRKVAVGIWVPVLVVALALLTGPNRGGGGAAAPLPTTTTLITTTTTIKSTTPSTSKRVDIGLWMLGRGKRRRMTIAGSVNTLQSTAQLQLKQHLLNLAKKEAERNARRAAHQAAGVPLPATPTTKPSAKP